ncbi:lipase [Chitiniphilus shinanonensis]|uniref:Lipase n=1 Tax=Chitiniphilus shinanonensis TaxID=553088 RepID=A0ABQ6BZW1_9NEIS|nr:GDSL-type esterase/lipase family protein [Chitiniphilus shinanonensis]GLS05782.1 lipase [Chitiniphilus shinanonensis]
MGWIGDRRRRAGLALLVLVTALPQLHAAEQATSLATVRAVGRVQLDDDGARYGWPGVYFEGRFRGTRIGLRFDDAINHFDVEVDGKPVADVRKPGRRTVWVEGLAPGEHTLRLAGRSEAPDRVGRFLGLVADRDGAVLPPPPARSRQIEFIGDSNTVGYGLRSTTHQCSDAEVFDRTDAQRSYGALTARHFGADVQINAYSGIGLVRNYHGMASLPAFPAFYQRTLPSEPGSRWPQPADWRPQVVAIGLGLNDFGIVPAQIGGLIADPFPQQFKLAYLALLADLRQRYGPDTLLVATATPPSSTFLATVRTAVAEARAAGDARVVYFEYGDLDLRACHWHPSARDHRAIARGLIALLEGAELDW